MGLKRLPVPGTVALTTVAYTGLSYMLLLAERPAVLTTPAQQIVAILPHAIAAVNAVALISLQLGYQAIRRRRINRHRLFMLTAFTLITAFLVMYVTRIYLGGVKTFTGPENVLRWVYLPMLTVHIGLSIASVPLVLYNVLVGLTHSFEEVGATRHPKVGRVAVTLWSVSLALGIAVYLMLNHLY